MTENAIVLVDHRQLTFGGSSSVDKGTTSLFSSTGHGGTQTEITSHETSTTSPETVQFSPSTKTDVIGNQGGEKLGILCIHDGENASESLLGVLSNHVNENAIESLASGSSVQALLARTGKEKIGKGKSTKSSEKGYVVRKIPVAKKNNSTVRSSGRTLKSPSVMGPAMTHHEP